MISVLPFRRLGRRSLLAVLVVALTLSLVPTAAFASSGGHYERPTYRRPNTQSYNRHAPRQYEAPRQSNRYDRYDRCETSYRVRRGDTLSEIARRYRVSVRELASVNGLRNPNRIYAGSTLCIPR